MDYNIRRVNRFNLKIIAAISIILTAQAFLATGTEYGIPSLIATGSAFVLGYFVHFLKANIYISGVLIPLFPLISAVILSHMMGGLNHLFTLYLVTICLCALYFNKKVLTIFTIVIFVFLSVVFAIAPQSLLGPEYYDVFHFGDRLVQLLSGYIILYFLVKWGNEAVLKSEKNERKANELSTNLKEIARNNSKLVKKITSHSKSLSQGADKGKESAENTSSLIQNMSAGIEEISAVSQEVASFSEEANRETDKGEEYINNTMASIKVINQEVDETVEVINNLNRDAQEINEVIGLISKIADQTNLLALNASVEAARAGSSGSGFAVVAEEIRDLSIETAEAADEISDLINRTKNRTEKSLVKINQVETKAKQGEEIAGKTKKVFKEIKESIEKTTAQVEEIANTTNELAQDSYKVNQAAEDITCLADNVAQAAKELKQMSKQLKDSITKLDGNF